MTRRVTPHFTSRRGRAEGSIRGLGAVAIGFVFFAWMGTDGFRYWPSLPADEPCEARGGKPEDTAARERRLTAAEIAFLAFEGGDRASRRDEAPCPARSESKPPSAFW